ncbi:hypothetical protein [Agrobacterium rosae]|nr:hypothetical protein [Agrobacterium rosae]
MALTTMNMFGEFVAKSRRNDVLVVQPRMGFGRIDQMRAGLRAVKAARGTTIGTITLDSYTRVGDHGAARAALAANHDLNGFPIVVHGAERTRDMLASIADADFPVQVRHGSAKPFAIFRTLVDAGIGATEGGPVSYCLPYGRTPLSEAIDEWSRCCALLGKEADQGRIIHLESFGGCLLGQLCPPSLLIAVSVLEGIFFKRFGVRSISLSYAQQTNYDQDLEALRALQNLGNEYLGDTDWHTVLYTYMGVFPKTEEGALDNIALSARLARQSSVARLIVKTAAEAHKIPTVASNIEALELCASVASDVPGQSNSVPNTGIEQEAKTLIENVLDLDEDLGKALRKAFASGQLDVPFCLHTDNAGRARSFLDDRGYLQWSRAGSMPINVSNHHGSIATEMTSHSLLDALSFVERRFDTPYLASMSPEHRISP